MKKIVLLCAAGMSTSLLVKKMKDYAATVNYECSIEAFPVSPIAQEAKEADIILLGPQVKFQLNKVKEQVSCLVEPIDMLAYGMMDGKKVMMHVIDVLGQ